MEIKTEFSNGNLTMRINGRIDTVTAPILEDEIKKLVTEDTKNLILDFEKVAYISSAGIRVIIGADKVMHRQGEMKLVHVDEEIMEIFDMTGLTDFLMIEQE